MYYVGDRTPRESGDFHAGVSRLVVNVRSNMRVVDISNLIQ